MVLKRLFREPTSITLFAATLLALFETINSAGYSDNIAISVGLIDSTPIAGEKITSPARGWPRESRMIFHLEIK